MAQRKALAVAGAISVTAMSAALAIGANFGLFGLAASPDTSVGTFTPAAIETVEADPAGTSEAVAAPSTEPPAAPAAAEAAPLDAPVEFASALPGEPAQAVDNRAPNLPDAAPPVQTPVVTDDDDDDDRDEEDHSGRGRVRGRGDRDHGDDDDDD